MPQTESEPSPAEDHPKPSMIGLVPHAVTVIVGLVALGDLLDRYGPSATKMIDGLITQLKAYSPDQTPPPNGSWNFTDALHSTTIWDVLGLGPFVRAIFGGTIDWVMLFGAFGLWCYFIVLRPIMMSTKGKMAYASPFAFPFFPWAFHAYVTLLKYILIIALTLFGGILGLSIAFICSLAGIFVAIKAFVPIIEMYHAGHSFKEIWTRIKG